jgi:transcriptional regulator with XRE-family HTH domain
MTLKDLVSANVARLRRQVGLTQSQLAGMLAITKQTVWRMESGATSLSLEMLEALAKVFRVEPMQLLAPIAGAVKGGVDDRWIDEAIECLGRAQHALQAHRDALLAARLAQKAGPPDPTP